MTVLDITDDPAQLTAALDALPNSPAVFVLWPHEGRPHLSKTTVLRRRLQRLRKMWNLDRTLARIEYRLTASGFESSIVQYEQARRLMPEDYLEVLRLRMPPYIKVVLGNEFPRSHLTTHLTRSQGIYYGPFRSRAAAERFESQFLDLFQMRRCQEDLAPSPAHPGCIYGEMAMCLRPCQEVVASAEYGREVDRVVEFLRSDGNSLLESIGHSRDRLSEQMMFEDAARQHKRFEKVLETLKLRDELAHEVDRLSGVAITASVAPDTVEMWFMQDGNWMTPQRFGFEVLEGKPAPLDRKLRECFASVTPCRLTIRERQEYLALLARWYYSSWREGEWVGFRSFDEIPYRKVVNAVSRVMKVGG
jgi:excinuclease UvrABC nuclease subunit